MGSWLARRMAGRLLWAWLNRRELVIACFIAIQRMASGVLGQGNGEVCISGLSSLPRHIAGPLTGPPGQSWSALASPSQPACYIMTTKCEWAI